MVVTRSQSKTKAKVASPEPPSRNSFSESCSNSSGFLPSPTILSTPSSDVNFSPSSNLTLSYGSFHTMSSSDTESDITSTTTPPPTLPNNSLPTSPSLPSYQTPPSQNTPNNLSNPLPPLPTDPLSECISLLGSNNLIEGSSTLGAPNTQNVRRKVKTTSSDSGPVSGPNPEGDCVKFIISGHANLHRSAHCASLMSRHICSQMSAFRLNDNGQIIKSSKGFKLVIY